MRLCASTAPSGTITDGSASPRTYSRCSVGARHDERVHVLRAAEMLERLREERVRVAVVERDVGRRAQHDEHARRVDAELARAASGRAEVGEVVLLLQARVLDELRRLDAVRLEPLGRDRVGDDDPRRGAAAELVLVRRELVVERRRARDAEPARRDRQLVGAMRERDVEVAALRPALAARRAGRSSGGSSARASGRRACPITASASRPCISSSSIVCA